MSGNDTGNRFIFLVPISFRFLFLAIFSGLICVLLYCTLVFGSFVFQGDDHSFTEKNDPEFWISFIVTLIAIAVITALGFRSLANRGVQMPSIVLKNFPIILIVLLLVLGFYLYTTAVEKFQPTYWSQRGMEEVHRSDFWKAHELFDVSLKMNDLFVDAHLGHALAYELDVPRLEAQVPDEVNPSYNAAVGGAMQLAAKEYRAAIEIDTMRADPYVGLASLNSRYYKWCLVAANRYDSLARITTYWSRDNCRKLMRQERKDADRYNELVNEYLRKAARLGRADVQEYLFRRGIPY